MRGFLIGLSIIGVTVASMIVAIGQEPKRLDDATLEREFAVVEAYLEQGIPGAAHPDGAQRPGRTIANFATSNVVQNLGHLPEGSPIRLRAIALARKHAAIPAYAVEVDLRKQKRPADVDDHLAHSRLGFSWRALIATNVLRNGLRLEDVVALVGPPTKMNENLAEWYYNSPMHVNPCLRYWRVGDREKKGRIEVTRF